MSEADALQAKYEQMTRTPVRRLVVRLAVPTIVSMVVTALYNVVDAAFVGRLSTEATAGIGISFAYMTFIQAVGFFFGHGSGNHISRALGAQKYDDAAEMAATGFFTPLFIGLISAVAGLIWLTPLSILLGATPDVVQSANDYLRYIVLASPFMMSALTLNNQLRLQGNSQFAMIGIVSGAILNIVLDPIFIFALNMGVTGASVATAVSQLFAWGLLLRGTMRNDSIHIRFSAFRPTLRNYYEILRGGLPSLCRQAFNCTAVIFLNYAAARWAAPGQEASAVAAFAVVSRVMMFAFSIVLGFCQGFQPVSGFNYGAGLYKRVRQSYMFALTVSTAFLFVISTLGYIFAPVIVRLFRSEDPELIRIGVETLRWQCLSFPLIGLSTTTNMLFQNIRMTFKSTIISIGRQGLFFIPAVLILPQFLGMTGVQISQSVADLCTFLLSIPYAIWILRKLKNMHISTQSSVNS
ncbi:MAG: MATE family efflux transporter [Bacteroidales bacterium]|nr:MATE family efflux transporter [Bacteroidales bacterium]